MGSDTGERTVVQHLRRYQREYMGSVGGATERPGKILEGLKKWRDTQAGGGSGPTRCHLLLGPLGEL